MLVSCGCVSNPSTKTACKYIYGLHSNLMTRMTYDDTMSMLEKKGYEIQSKVRI